MPKDYKSDEKQIRDALKQVDKAVKPKGALGKILSKGDGKPKGKAGEK